MSLVPPDPELDPIESALGKLVPARSRLDRDRLMFQAGVNSVQSRSTRQWVWPAVAASLAVVALSESVVLATRPRTDDLVARQQPPALPVLEPAVTPAPVQILVQAGPSREAEPESWLPAAGAVLGLRQQLLRFGLEGLPDTPALLSQADGAAPVPGSKSDTSGPLHRYELNKVLDLGGPS